MKSRAVLRLPSTLCLATLSITRKRRVGREASSPRTLVPKSLSRRRLGVTPTLNPMFIGSIPLNLVVLWVTNLNRRRASGITTPRDLVKPTKVLGGTLFVIGRC